MTHGTPFFRFVTIYRNLNTARIKSYAFKLKKKKNSLGVLPSVQVSSEPVCLSEFRHAPIRFCCSKCDTHTHRQKFLDGKSKIYSTVKIRGFSNIRSILLWLVKAKGSNAPRQGMNHKLYVACTTETTNTLVPNRKLYSSYTYVTYSCPRTCAYTYLSTV